MNCQLHNFTVPPPVSRPWSVSLIYQFLWAATRHVPSIFFLSVEWLRLLALYDYSICIMMSRTCCCYNLFPLFSPLCLTQHITQWLFEKILVMDNFSFSLLSRCSISLPFCLVDVLFSGRFVDLLVSSTLADPQVCSSQQCGISPWCWKQPRGFSSAVAAKADCRILTCSSRQWSEKVSCPVLFILTKRDKRHWNKEWLSWRWYTFFLCARSECSFSGDILGTSETR